jgi:hypothetical protein
MNADKRFCPLLHTATCTGSWEAIEDVIVEYSQINPSYLCCPVNQSTVGINGFPFSICRLKTAAGRDNLYQLRNMYQGALDHQPISETLMLKKSGPRAGLRKTIGYLPPTF